jgi:hypothetical protein
MPDIGPPDPSEYAPFFERYISLVPREKILPLLEAQPAEVRRMLGGLSEEQAGYRYAEGKWSIREVLGHLIDTERVFGYRALCVARGDTTSLPSFDEKAYASNAPHDDHPLAELLGEFETVRKGQILLFRHLRPEDWTRMGVANNNPISPRAMAYNMAGHLMHHLNGLRDNYGVKV